MCQVGGITIKNKEYSEHTRKYLESLGVTNYQSHYKVPCGQCKDCLQARANSWLVRLRSHMKDTFSSYFVTLTYENPPRSYNGLFTAKKDDLQRYFKRLRKIESENQNIKYYAVSEYGEQYQRPHYHAIIFNVNDRRSILRAWAPYDTLIGQVHIGDVTSASIKYVSGYIGKKIGIPQYDYDDRLPEFSLMSKGLGKNILDYQGDFLKDTLTPYTYVDGIKYPIPRYIKDKLFGKTFDRHLLKLKTFEHYEKRQLQIETTLINRGISPFDIASLSVDACQNAKQNSFYNDKIIS